MHFNLWNKANSNSINKRTPSFGKVKKLTKNKPIKRKQSFKQVSSPSRWKSCFLIRAASNGATIEKTASTTNLKKFEFVNQRSCYVRDWGSVLILVVGCGAPGLRTSLNILCLLKCQQLYELINATRSCPRKIALKPFLCIFEMF